MIGLLGNSQCTKESQRLALDILRSLVFIDEHKVEMQRLGILEALTSFVNDPKSTIKAKVWHF